MTQAPITDAGPEPDLAWLPVTRCRVDSAYQRSIQSKNSQGLIARISANFRWAAFQAVLATPDPKEEGWFLILDGQHRVEAARRRGVARVPAVVVAAASVAEQALAFVRANKDRVALTALAMFHASVAAGDKEAKAIAEICRAARVTIPPYQAQLDKMKPGEMIALGTIRILLNKQGRDMAQLALDVVADAWRGHGGALRASVIKAVAILLTRVADEAERLELASRITAQLVVIGPENLSIAVTTERAKGGMSELQAHEAVIRRAVAAAPRAKPKDKPVVASKPVEKIIVPAKPSRAEVLKQTAAIAAKPAAAPPPPVLLKPTPDLPKPAQANGRIQTRPPAKASPPVVSAPAERPAVQAAEYRPPQGPAAPPPPPTSAAQRDANKQQGAYVPIKGPGGTLTWDWVAIGCSNANDRVEIVLTWHARKGLPMPSNTDLVRMASLGNYRATPRPRCTD